MDFIGKQLDIIARCIEQNTYEEVETDRLELKDLSAGWGVDCYKSVCAFLNTNGGVLVIGIRDRDNPPKGTPKSYKFTGYDNSKDNENHLKQVLPKKFTDKEGVPIDLTAHISRFEIRDFLGGRVALVYIEELDSEQKYVYYEGGAYVRKLTGDHLLDKTAIEEYEEIKADIIRHQELQIVEDVALDSINLEALNQYIHEYNRGKKRGETYKVSIETALPFLVREGFVRDNQPTLMGMLVCGNEPERHILGKCQADCYVILRNRQQVAQDKEIIQDNILELIQRALNFVWRNIRVGIGYAKGGTAEPEYPEALIRESVINAFAHRDYKSDAFVILEIRPQESLMIRNPGMFERRQRINKDTKYGNIRRIIPLQVARNPKLTHLLKSFDYWEGKGRGLTALIDACLDNQIDLPYYLLSANDIKLFIPTGKILDDEMEFWLQSFAGYLYGKVGRSLHTDEKIMLAFFKKSEEQNRLERYTILITPDNNHHNVIANLADVELIIKNPDSPELYPIYQVDRTLIQKNFGNTLKKYFGPDWDSISLKQDYYDVLNAIYWHNEYGEKTALVSANSIGEFLYFSKYRKITQQNEFENYKRKIRNIFNQLEAKKFIVRRDGKTKEEGGRPDFEINKNYTVFF